VAQEDPRPRHLDRRALRDTQALHTAYRDEVLRLLANRGLPTPTDVEIVTEGRPAWRTFKTRRTSGGGRRGNLPPVGLRLTFAEPVAGPICLGYGAHFGLGLFAPEGAYPVR
jgi:CRISPR-associated protein Csb2